MRRREHWACPGSVWAGLALGCHRSTCLSFMEKLEMGVGWMRWDNLGSHPGDTGGSSLSLPSLVEHQSGRTIVHPQRFYRGTGTATPSSAFAVEAGIRQKKRGELPQQLSGAPWGPCPPGSFVECAHILRPAQRCGARNGGPEPAADGAVLLFPAMLCLRREGGCHHMRTGRL